MSAWTFPEELEPYRELITNTGGNSVEDLINDLDANKNLMRTNVVRFVLAVAAQAQIGLLQNLAAGGHLATPDKPGQGTARTFTDLAQRASTTGLFFPGVEHVHEVSDGYHTMGELYDHRRALTVALARALEVHPRLTVGSWRSKRHHPDDSPMFKGYFIVGLELTSDDPMARNTVTYHYKLKHWDEFEGVPILEHALKWDGAEAPESITRLMGADL